MNHVLETQDQGEIERNAYNAAFYELGLRWHWDEDTFARLRTSTCERERVRTYLQAHQAHLLRAYDVEFLIDAIIAKKTCHSTPGCVPSDSAYFDWAESRAAELGS
jgi:hypothetical protein